MTRVAKGKRSRPSYVCTRAKVGGECAYKSVPCAVIEGALIVVAAITILQHAWMSWAAPHGLETLEDLHRADLRCARDRATGE